MTKKNSRTKSIKEAGQDSSKEEKSDQDAGTDNKAIDKKATRKKVTYREGWPTNTRGGYTI